MRHLTPLFAAAALILSTAPAYAANPCNQLAKLLANDASTLDNFGVSVAISDGIPLVGAPQHDDLGPNSGAPYLFDTSDPENAGEPPESSTPPPVASHGPLAGASAKVQSVVGFQSPKPDGSVRTLSGTGCDVIPEEGSNMGTDFIIAFLPNVRDPSGLSVKLHLTAPLETSVTIQYPVNGPVFEVDMTVDLTPGDVTIVDLPWMASLHWAADYVRNNAVHVFADNAFGVYMVNLRGATSDAALALPIAALGTAYVVIDYGTTNLNNINSVNQFVVYAVEDSTTVTIVPTVELAYGHLAGEEFDVLLNRGEGYYAESLTTSMSPNLTGTTVSSDRPVGLTNGNKCTFIPEGNPWCDHVFEVAQPVQTWGTQAFVTNLVNQPNGTIYRIVASEDGTTVSQDGIPIGMINLGEFKEVGPLLGIHIFSADKPIFVVQYMIGVNDPDDPDNDATLVGDPSMGNVIPPEQYLSSYVFSTVGGSPDSDDEQFSEHFVRVIAEFDDLTTIEFDGDLIGAENFVPILDSGFWAISGTVSPGVHCTSSNGVHGIIVYGYNVDDSYLYPGGVSFSVPTCLWDLSGDGDVGPFDLALLLGNWGPCPEPCGPGDPAATCAEDLDGNCDVGPFDLALLLGNWGPCP